MIPRETIDRVFAAAKIEEVVGDYVTLKRRGANLLGLCPFHNEKTPSFTVSPAKGIYKCFGCGKSGHAIGFVMDIEQCNFADAVKQVAKKYHIEIEERELTPEEQQRQDDRESMFVVNEFANRWFQEQLWNTKEGQTIGLAYFRERGLREDIVRKFQLGYSPEKGNPLAAALKKKGFVEQYLLNDPESKIGTGICGKSEDGRLYDRFRDRVIFPIHTVSGKTVGFAGRILKKKENTGKYVNSPDSIIYSKTNELYGLFFAKQAIAREDLCYLVEGQMDAISMHQAGIENVVCSGGTALTKPQIRLIHRFTSNITILYDGDAAGIHAALRGIDMFLEEEFNVKVVLLPDGEDPDSFARTHNASDFIEYIHTGQADFIQYKTELLLKDVGDDPVQYANVMSDVLKTISKIPNRPKRDEYAKYCSVRFKREQKEIINEIEEFRKDEEHVLSKRVVLSENDRQRTELEEKFLNLIQVIVRRGDMPLYDREDGTGKYTAGEYIIDQLTNDGVEAPNPLYQKVIDEFRAHHFEPDFRAERFYKFHPDVEISRLAVDLIADKYQLSRNQVSAEAQLSELVPQLLLELKLTVVNLRIETLEKNLKQAQAQGNWEEIRQLLAMQPQLLDVRNQICRTLKRVITL